MQKNSSCCFILMVIMIAFMPALMLPIAAHAQEFPERPPTEDLLPETTIAYAKITSFSEMYEKMQRSMGAKMIEDDAFAPLAKQLYETAEEQYANVEDKVGLSMDELTSLPSGELSIALVAPRRKDMALVVVMELDDENEAVDKAFDRARDLLAGDGEIEEETNEFNVKIEKAIVKGNVVHFCRHQGVMIASSSLEVLEAMLVRWSGGKVEKVRSLSQNRKYITINNRCSASEELQPDMRFFVDPIAIFKAYARGNVGMQVGVAVLPTLGLDGVLAIGGNSYYLFEGYETIAHGHVLLASPREGIIDAIALKPGSYQPQSWVPVNIGSYMTTSWDAQQMFAKIGEIVDTFNEDSFQGWLEDVKENGKIDVKADIIDALTGRVTVVRPILSGSEFNAIGNVVAAELIDPESFTEFLESFLTQEDFGDAWQPVEHEGVTYWTLGDGPKERIQSRRERRRARRNEQRIERGEEPLPDTGGNGFTATFRFPRPSCAVLDGNLIFGDNEEFIRTAIETFNGDHDALVDNEDFQRTAKMMTRLLKTDFPAGMVYADSARELALVARAIDSDAVREQLGKLAENKPEYFSGLKAAIDDNEIPSYENISKFIPPSGGFVTTDDSGYHILLFQETRDTDEE